MAKFTKIVSKKTVTKKSSPRITIPLDKIHKGTLYIYCRVSSKKQGDKTLGNTSLSVQKEECLKRGVEKGWKKENIVVIEEVMSAKDMKMMKGFQAMKRKLKFGDTVYMYSVTRFSRNMAQGMAMLSFLEEKGVNYHFLQENLSSRSTASQKLTLHNMLATSEFERDQMMERLNASIVKRKKLGSRFGKAPYGYMNKRVQKGDDYLLVLEKDDKEQEVLNLIRKLIGSGVFDMNQLLRALESSDEEDEEKDGMSFTKVAEKLNELGYKMRNGKEWTASSVKYYYKKEE